MPNEEMRKKDKRRFYTILILGSVLVLLAIYLNSSLARLSERVFVQSEGQLRLSNITSNVENNLSQAENYILAFATQVELLIKDEGLMSEDVLYEFIHAQNKMLGEKTDGQCFSAYVAYRDKLYIEDFVPDENFRLTERTWYVGAKKNQGKVYITAPYVDASTNSMCYTVSMLLDDGSTIVSLDFYMDAIQTYIEEMNKQIDGISMIINEGGMIVGYDNSEVLGQDYTVLKEYRELIEKVFNLYGDYFEYTVHEKNDVKYTVFSDKTTYGWYLIVCLPSEDISSGVGSSTIVVNIIILLLWAIFLIVVIVYFRRQRKLIREVDEQNYVLEFVADTLREPIMGIVQEIGFSEKTNDKTYDAIKQYAQEMQEDLDSITIYRDVNNKGIKRDEDAEDVFPEEESGKYKKYSMAIIGVLLISSIVSIAVNTYMQFNYTKSLMENEGDIYMSQAKSWIDTNITLTHDMALHLGAQPDLYQDYDKAVSYLNNVVKDNEDISVAYIVNPAWEHTVIMNNRWEPDDDWHVEERDWYVDTVLSEQGFNISTPYQDEQTKMYCVTFSEIVYDEQGNIVGLVGVDFYMDTLIKILGESYTANGYAFLTDPSYIILNHPSEQYQMSLDNSVNAAEREYRQALASEKLTFLKDYDGTDAIVLAQREPKSGFTVITVRTAGAILTPLVLTDVALLLVFAASILFVMLITRYMVRRQEELNKRLRLAAEKAIEAGKAKSQFLAQMLHEIRTPINAVLGMNEMILRSSREEAVLGYASSAYNAGKALLSIINDVLDISKIEAGKLEIVKSEYDLSSLITDCYNMTVMRANSKGLDFRVTVDPTLPSRLYGDMYHLRQIIVNFITNAIKYTNEGSVELKFAKANSADPFELCVSVADTGIGLTDEDKEKLFSSFQRFDLKRNQSIEGSGLGLAICKQLAQLMGGRVEVESEYGKGSTFSCILAQEVLLGDPVGEVVPGGRDDFESIRTNYNYIARDARILAVDDVEMNLKVFEALLSGHQYIIDEALSGKQCLELIKQNHYDVIFLDNMMPEMDGVETFQCMRETEHKNNGTPVVMLTANAISGEREKFLQEGFAEYLTKPLQSEKLETILLKFIEKEKIAWQESSPEDAPSAEGSQAGTIRNADISPELIDIGLGLSYCGEKEDTYLTLLDSYVLSGQGLTDALESLFQKKTWEEYVIKVHALKGTSLTIGARKLSEAAKELEFAGKAKEYDIILSKHGALMELYKKVLAAAQKLVKQYAHADEEQKEAAGSKEASKEELTALLDQIMEAADDFDPDRITEICHTLKSCVYQGKAFDGCANELLMVCKSFDYEAAREKAGSIKESL